MLFVYFLSRCTEELSFGDPLFSPEHYSGEKEVEVSLCPQNYLSGTL